ILERAAAKQFVSLLHEVVALALLLADVHEAERGFRDAEDFAGEHASHDAVIEEVPRLRANVGTDIDDDAMPACGGHHRGDSGTMNALQEFVRLEAAGDDGSGVPGADEA